MFEDKFTMHRTVLPVINSGLKKIITSRTGNIFAVLSIYIVSRAVLLIIGMIALHMVPPSAATQLGLLSYSYPNNWLGLWSHWDSAWYSRIADQGYTGPILTPGDFFGQASYAFFPLLPLLTKVLSKVLGIQILAAGLLLANAMQVIAGIFLYRYVVLRFDNRQIALTAVTAMFFFPGSFVFSSFMTESLYLSLAIISFFYMEKEQYGRGAAAASLITIARSPGILFFFIFILHWLRKNHDVRSILENDWRSFLKILLIPLPLLMFMGFLFTKFDSAFAFSQVHVFWGRSLATPLQSLFHDLFYFHNLSDISGALVSFVAFFTVSLIIINLKRLTAEEIIFSLAGILVPLSTSLESAIRLCDVIFPLFIAISLLSGKYPKLGLPLIASLAMINAMLMVFWVIGTSLYV